MRVHFACTTKQRKQQLCSVLIAQCAMQAAIYMGRVIMLHGSSQPLKDLASQFIVSLTWQAGEFRQILQSECSTTI